MRIVVVFPEPFGPRNPVTVPLGTSRSRPPQGADPPETLHELVDDDR